MATKNKITLNFDGLEEMIKQLDAVEGDLRTVTEKALIASKEHVTEELRRVTVPANFPAGGKYSTGRTASSIDESKSVLWEGTTASIPVGFDLNISGLTSIFLLRGTPKHKPPMKQVRPMYNAIYGSKIKKEVQDIQRQVFADEIKKKMG